MYACICMYVYVCMYMYACICICMCVCMCVCVYVCMYVYVCVYAYMCMYVCITYWGNCPGGNVLPKTGGGIVRGGNCPEGIVRGELSYTRIYEYGLESLLSQQKFFEWLHPCCHGNSTFKALCFPCMENTNPLK